MLIDEAVTSMWSELRVEHKGNQQFFASHEEGA
jgi:hypothetical protein